MDWWVFLIGFLGSLILLMLLGVPLAMAFLSVNFIFIAIIMGLGIGGELVIYGIFDSLAKFTLVPIPLFILMGEVLYLSGVATRAMDAMAMWLGRIPGRLSLLAISSGALFASLSGSSIANTALLGSTLMPEMRARGYHKSMYLGPILASGGLAMVIPPSAISVLLASIANVSVGKLLLAGLLPGLLMGALYFGYVIIRCWLNPRLAPTYEMGVVTWGDKLRGLVYELLPLGGIIFLVLGLMFLGVATPTESAALGAAGALVLVAARRNLTFQLIKKALLGTMKVTGMILLIIAGASAFSHLLAFTGASRELVDFIVGVGQSPLAVLLLIQAVIIILGMFLDQSAIIMLTVPMLMPIVAAMSWDPIWFLILFLINLEMAATTPPIGLLLFVMKGVAARDVTLKDVTMSALPFLLCDAAAMILIMTFPSIATVIPALAY